MATKTVAEIIIDTIQAAAARRVYGLASDSLNLLLETIAARAELSFVPVRHQEAGALAAGADANITGRLGVCTGACGPGNTQLVNGLYDCHRSRLPVLAIAMQVPTTVIGSGGFQETHPAQLFQECSYYCEQISVPEQAVHVVEAAVQTALSLGGVAVIIVPADVLAKTTEAPAPRIPGLGHHSAIVPADDKIAQAALLLNACENVTILAGSGTDGAHAELLQAAQTLQAPIVHSLSGKECVEASNPFDVGTVDEVGMLAVDYALHHAHGILMLGDEFIATLNLPANVPVVQVEKRAQLLGRLVRADVGLHGTPAETIRKLLPYLRPRSNQAHLQAAQRQCQADRQALVAQATTHEADAPLRPQHVAYCLNKLAADDAIFTCDVGTPLHWASCYLHMNGRRRLINSFVHGSIGAAMPQAIGAALASASRQVVALCGDGGLAMLLGELLTIHQLAVPVKLIIFNNGGYRSTELQDQGANQTPTNTRLANPDFAQLAEVMGIRELRVSSPAQLEAVLREALSHPGPVLVDAVVAPQEMKLPDPNSGFTSMKNLLDESAQRFRKATSSLLGS